MSRHRVLGVMALALVASCSDPAPAGDDRVPASQPGPSGAECGSTTDLSYESFASDFFGEYCVRCHGSQVQGSDRHGAPTSLNYDTLEGIKAIPAERIDAMAAAGRLQLNTFMPPSDPRPSVAEREKLGQWLACDRP